MPIESTVTGIIGADCKQVMLGQTPALQFNVASTRSRKDKNGEYVTDWISVTYFTTQLAPYLTKGRWVNVHGEITASPYIAQQNEVRAGLQIAKASRIDLLGGKGTFDAQQQQVQPMQAAPQQPFVPAPQPQYAPPQQPGNDGMPF